MARKPRNPLRKAMDRQIARMRIYGQLFRRESTLKTEILPHQTEIEIEGNPNETDRKDR